MKEVSTLGIDIAKNVFQLHGVDRRERVVLNKQLTRLKLLNFIAKLPPCLIGIEACSGANYWAREFKKFGHDVKQMSPQFVKPYVKSNKNDYRDAEAIAEAVRRPTMRFVPTKQIWQQDMECIHRIRERLIQQRTALSNQMRGLLSEYGIVMAQGVSKLKKQLPLIIEDVSNELTDKSRKLFDQLLEELKNIEDRLMKYDSEIKQLSLNNEACQRLQSIPGVGPLTATAVLATLSDAKIFKNGRQFSAWLGLVPRQNSSGGKTLLLGISKRGNRYVRTLLVHGARSVLKIVQNKKDRINQRLVKKIEEKGFNKMSVALANKNARVIWALMAHGTHYKKLT